MSRDYPLVKLKPGRDVSVRRFHPWIFSGAIQDKPPGLNDGQVVAIASAEGNLLAVGHYYNGSIAVKILSFAPATINRDFWQNSIAAAWGLRRTLGLIGSDTTDAFRLINAEGDGLPGLIVDLYGSTAVIQCQTEGVFAAVEDIAAALDGAAGEQIKNIYLQEFTARGSGDRSEGRYLKGALDRRPFVENGRKFLADWEAGQKTGFFLDQRENRLLNARYCRGASMLNLFCYSGGFSIYALTSGAEQVTSVDSSKAALELLEQNLRLNGISGRHESVDQDCFDYVRRTGEQYDLAVVDPPAFVKHKNALVSGLKGYTEINALALVKLKPGGLLATFSCSQLVDQDAFLRAVALAAQQAKRQLKILHILSSAPCHPISAHHPEGR